MTKLVASRLFVGNGFIGSALATSSSLSKCRTRLVSRGINGIEAMTKAQNVDLRVGDASNQDFMRRALEEIDEVY